MMMHSSSFESLKPYLFGYYLKNSITALLRYVILAQSTPILLHTEGLVSFVSLTLFSWALCDDHTPRATSPAAFCPKLANFYQILKFVIAGVWTEEPSVLFII